MKNYFETKKKELEELKSLNNLNEILNKVYKILGNPVVLFDTSYNLFAHTQGIVTDDFLWNEFVTHGKFSHKSVDFFNSEKFIISVSNCETVNLLKSDKLKYDRINGKLFDKDNVQLGDICIVACCQPFKKEDIDLANYLCQIISSKLQNSEFYKKIDKVYQTNIFTQLLDETDDFNPELKKQAQKMQKEFKKNLYVAAVDTIQYEETMTHLAYFRDLFKEIQPQFKYFIHLNNIVILISINKECISLKNDLNKLNEFFKQYKLYAGVSSRFNNLFKLKKYYKEAINALNYGLKGKRKEHIFCFDDFKIEYYLNSLSKEKKKSLCHPVVEAIEKYDKKNKSCLLDFLYYCLLYSMDFKEVCNKLQISKNQFDLNIKLLKEVFEIEFDNIDMIYSIFMNISLDKF